MFISILIFSLGALLGGGIVFIFYRNSATHKLKYEKKAHTETVNQYDGKLAKLSQRLSEEQVHTEQIKQSYIKPIAQVLDFSADNADNASLDMEHLSGRLLSLGNTVAEIINNANEVQKISVDSANDVSLTLKELSQLSQSQQDLQSIETQFFDIQEKTKAIRYIGEEAEMLALNAAIEAARAGDAGRGFAVVADNMKQLAKNSQTTTIEILFIVDQCALVIQNIGSNFTQRGDSLNSSINELVGSFSHISTSITHIQQLINSMSDDTKSAIELSEVVEKNTKNSVEVLVKDLSKIVSVITEKEVVDLLPEQVRSRWNEFDQIIDVRRENEWEDELGHISGVKMSTLQTDFKQYVKSLDKKKCYLFICRSGGRSTKAAQMALAFGVVNVSNLDGGMLAWRKKGY